MRWNKKIFALYFLSGIISAGGCFFAAAQELDTGITGLRPQEKVALTEDISQKSAQDITTESSPKPSAEIASLRFVWNVPVNVAAFERNGKIWIVFDRPNRIDIDSLKNEAKNLAREIYSLPHPGGTIVVITPAPGIKYALRKEGLLWIVDLYSGRSPQAETQDLTIFTQYDSLKQTYLFIPNNQTGNILSIIDPEVGDIISISTTAQLGLGLNTAYRYPDFDILPTFQGLAFVINAPDIVLNRGNSGITLKALGRSLNITSDLDFLKRSQHQLNLDKEAAHASAFNLQIAQDLASRGFTDVVDTFKQDILSAPQNQKNIIRLKLAQYYVYNGLGTNALYILNQMKNLNLPESQTEHFRALSGIANFLARRYQEAVEDFSFGSIPESAEGVFWRTIAQSASEYHEENNAIIFSHISLMRDYPQAIKDEVAIIAARNAIATGDDLSSQNFIDILNSVPDRLRNLEPQITYLAAQKLEMQGYIRNAVKEYQKLLDGNSTMFSTYARLHHTILSQMVNFIDTKKAIAELEKLRFAWGEQTFKIRLLNQLADFYLKDQDYYNTLRVLNEEFFLVTGEQKNLVAGKMVKIFEDIFIGNHADEKLSPIKSLALYQDFKWLAGLSTRQNMIIQKLSDRLVAVDLLPHAQELLLNLLQKQDLSPDNRARIGSRLAVIDLFENNPQSALTMLEITNAPDLSSATVNPRRIIAARALSALGRSDEALALLKDDMSPNAIRHRFEIYWNAGDWDNASNTIKYLIEEPTPGEKLPLEQVNYILDWATTLKQAGKETVLVRLRNKFMPYFKDTPYESAFGVLTSHLEENKIDIKNINNVINDIQNFSNFSKFYTESLKESNLE